MLDEIKMLPLLLFYSWLIPLASEQSEKEAKTTAPIADIIYKQTDIDDPTNNKKKQIFLTHVKK